MRMCARSYVYTFSNPKGQDMQNGTNPTLYSDPKREDGIRMCTKSSNPKGEDKSCRTRAKQEWKVQADVHIATEYKSVL